MNNSQSKSYVISKHVVMEAYEKVKSNRGAAGIDAVSLSEFEEGMKDNLYKIWNRMSSGTYFPPPVKQVEIPKKSGGVRTLGIPTVSDRVAQMVVKMYLEPELEPEFHQDSYGYRPNKSAIDAVRTVRERCWRYDWVVEFDIVKMFDAIDHNLLMKALAYHTDEKWILMYVKRWLTAPFVDAEGKATARISGTPQGGVISPLLANLFMHYAFDIWMLRKHPNNPFARYADDGVIHCRTEEEAKEIVECLRTRMQECGLEIHPDKTKIIYCKDNARRDDNDDTTFTFLGFDFRPRESRNKAGKLFTSFCPAISKASMKSIRDEIRSWNLRNRTSFTIVELCKMIRPKLIGWQNYYCSFYKTEFKKVYKYLNYKLYQWCRKKYKNSKKKAWAWLLRVMKKLPHLLPHWKLGITNGLH